MAGRDRTLAQSSALVGAASVASRLLGFLRDVMIATALGSGPVADAFLVAFRLPTFARKLLGEGGLNAPFVPLYLAIRGGQSREAAIRFAGETLGVFGLGLLGLLILAEIFAPWLVLGFAPGLAGEAEALASQYARLALPFLAFATLASILAALLNAEGRFLAAALAPLAVNLVLIAALALGLLLGFAPGRLALALAGAVSLGGLLHLGLLGVALGRGRPGWPRLRPGWSPETARLFGLAGPALIAAATPQLVLLVATQIASTQPGALSWLYYADRIFQLPFGVVAVAMGVVLLPEIARREAVGDIEGRDRTVEDALRFDLALAIPAAAALATIAEPIVAALFERGAFTGADRAGTATALAGLAPGLPFGAAALVLSQIFFARGEPRGPLLAGLVALAVALLAGFLLPGGNAARTGALAASFAFATQATVLAALLTRGGIWRPGRRILAALGRICVATLLMVLALVALQGWLTPWLLAPERPLSAFAAFSLLCLSGLAIYGAGAAFFGVAPLDELRRLRR